MIGVQHHETLCHGLKIQPVFIVFILWHCLIVTPGGPLVSEVGYHPRKKNHVIRVVFQDKAMYARTSFRGAKTCKIGKKGYVFGHIDKFLNEHDAQIKKNTSKNAYLGSIFIPEKYVLRVCFENPFTRMISSLKYKWPPGAASIFWYFSKNPYFWRQKYGFFFKKPKISTSLFWGFSKTRYFCCRNLGIFTRVKILGYFTRNYRAGCDFIRRAKYSWSSIFGRCFMRMSQVC